MTGYANIILCIPVKRVQINPRLIVLRLNIHWSWHNDACFGSPFDIVDFAIIVAERIRTSKTERTVLRSHRRDPQVGIRGDGFAFVIINSDLRLKTRCAKTSKNNNRFLCHSKPNKNKNRFWKNGLYKSLKINLRKIPLIKLIVRSSSHSDPKTEIYKTKYF